MGFEGTGERREFVADRAGRLDAVLARLCPDLSRARLQRLIEAGHVEVNAAPARKAAQVSAGDRLALEVPPVEHPSPHVDVDIPVLFEDDWLVVIDKPAGLAVHGAPGESGPTVAAWFVEHHIAEASAFDAE
ncbi:MAG: S4 domain-containing protein, partial [Hyphomicrobiales bacterium]